MRPRPVTPRPLAPHCRGGASSLLRLSAAGAAGWPAASALASRVAESAPAESVAAPMVAPMVAPAPAALSPLFTRLWPSGALRTSAAERLAV